jgi:enoyl-CoA hydratase/carnithine racemase
MTTTPGIGLERRGSIGVPTIGNPARRNAFTPDMRREPTASLTNWNRPR